MEANKSTLRAPLLATAHGPAQQDANPHRPLEGRRNSEDRPSLLRFPQLLASSMRREENDNKPLDARRTSSRAVYTPYVGASSEMTSFPHFASCLHCRTNLAPDEARWGTGLCDSCYEACERTCHLCGSRLELKQLHWSSGLCNDCYDSCDKACTQCSSELSFARMRARSVHCDNCQGEGEEPQTPQTPARAIAGGSKGTSSAFGNFDAGVKISIASQFIFYLAPGIMVPSLYLELQAQEVVSGGSAASSYSFVLMTCTVVAMAAPVPFGVWAEKRGEREVYAGVTLIATLASLLLAYSTNVYVFAMNWGLLSAPLALRGVRYAYFARSVDPDDLSAAGQLSSAAGLVGGLLGPLLAAVAKNSFFWSAMAACLAHGVCAVGLAVWLPPQEGKRGKDASDLVAGVPREECCEKCGTLLQENEKPYGTSLCNKCYDNWFRHFKRKVLFCFCGVAGLLELSMNMGVVAAFQPLAVEGFGWGINQIAAVNFLSSLVSVVVSVALARLRLPEFGQAAAAAALYAGSVCCFCSPPLAEWRLVVGLVLGLKAQILFMAPFTAAFSRLIGGSRVTNALTTVLCLAPLIGAALGTALAPLVLPTAGTLTFLVINVVPCAIAVVIMVSGWGLVRSRDGEGNKIRPAKLGARTAG